MEKFSNGGDCDFYSVINVFNGKVLYQWFFRRKDDAEKKYKEESEKLKSHWGYNQDYTSGRSLKT
jgi:hypothetical protein